MDSVISALVGAAPQLGGAGVLVMVLVLLIRREAQTNVRHASELTRLSSAHQAELSGLRSEIAGLRDQVTELNRRLDEERRARWAAEDHAAKHRRAGPTRPETAGETTQRLRGRPGEST